MKNIKIFEGQSTRIVYCCVDRTKSMPNWGKELIKNQTDYTITNLHCKGYTVLQGVDEDLLLREAAKNFQIAVVFSTGTEFITGTSFFEFVESLNPDLFFLYGHILDRKDAYYELHSQCYVINLGRYRELGCPAIGQQTLGAQHTQIEPSRSMDNYHDDYTPVWIDQGSQLRQYNHRAHGWNILSIGLSTQPGGSIKPFSESVRREKKHYYPENKTEFFSHVSWAYARQHHCENELVHQENTEDTPNLDGITQIFTPAAGGWWMAYPGRRVVVYDYNENSLSYWRDRCSKIEGLKCEFMKLNLLVDDINLKDILDVSQQCTTLINFSNIFVYEGTTFFAPLEFRLHKENKLLSQCIKYFPNATVAMSSRAITGFHPDGDITRGKSIKPIELLELNCPTWHVEDWQ